MNAIDKINTEIQDIHAKINKMKRIYDEALENLNLGGTVAQIRREMDGKYASFEVSANRILMRVGDVERGLRSELSVTASAITSRVEAVEEENDELTIKLSEIKQTAESITATVEKHTNDISDIDGRFEDYYSKSEIDQKADSITFSVSGQITDTKEYAESVAFTAESNANSATDEKLKSYTTIEKMNSAIEQKADSITSTVAKAIFTTGNNPNEIEPGENTHNMLCLYENKYYSYDSEAKEWVEYSGETASMFKQTSDGFTLKGDVTIYGDIRSQRLYSTKGTYYAKVYSSVGDLGLYKGDAKETDNPINESCIWGVYHSDTATGVVNMYSYGHNFLGYNNSQGKTWAKGNWSFCPIIEDGDCVVDFSRCTEVIFNDKTVVAGVAVFA